MPPMTWNKPSTLVRMHNAFRAISMRDLPRALQSCVATQVFSVGMSQRERGEGRDEIVGREKKGEGGEGGRRGRSIMRGA